MDKIPAYKISDIFEDCNVILLHIAEEKTESNVAYVHHRAKHSLVESVHRDDYYIFFLVQEGSGRVCIDFKEYQLDAGTIHCITPGQIHQPAEELELKGWFMAVDSLYVKSEYKKILEKHAFVGKVNRLATKEIDELDSCLRLLEKRLERDAEPIGHGINADLISAFIGMIADIYQRNLPASLNNRATEITFRFKSLLTENYATLKRPAEYAGLMNLSPVYLNEVVKKISGISVSQQIKDEIVLQSKRLLYYTDLTIKEIALKLGYEDWAYFTRLFTKSTGLSPSQFRQKNLR